MVDVGPLDPPHQGTADSVHPGLLGQFPHHRRHHRFSGLDVSTGNRPESDAGLPPPPDHEKAFVAHRYRPDAEFGATTGHRPSNHLCTSIPLATMPWVSKKFFVARSPGSASDSMPTAPLSTATEISIARIASPTPTIFFAQA